VFQDSIIFNLTLRENIAFSMTASTQDIDRAIATAELNDFIAALPQGLETVVSERGTSLSGGQKQRVMRARAGAQSARAAARRLHGAPWIPPPSGRSRNVHRDYPGITLISVTQKIAIRGRLRPDHSPDGGEVLAVGTHRD